MEIRFQNKKRFYNDFCVGEESLRFPPTLFLRVSQPPKKRPHFLGKILVDPKTSPTTKGLSMDNHTRKLLGIQ